MIGTVEVARLVPRWCVQCPVEQGVDVLVPKFQRTVQVGKARLCGNHVHQSGDSVGEQIDAGLVPRHEGDP